jgi:hypothetical protein
VRAHRIDTRRTEARELREEAAELAFLRPHPDHLSNGEESEYRRPLPFLPPPPPPPPPPAANNGELSYIANYSKGLRHNRLGEVNQSDYRRLLRALYSGNPDHFEQIPLGPSGPPCPPPPPLRKRLKLTNPQAGLAFDLEGPDAQAVTMPPAPRIDSAQNSAEMGELYWMALLRDVSFIDYGTGANTDAAGLTTDAANSLTNEFTDFRGPKVEPPPPAPPFVTPDTLFRGFTPGDLAGPYVSQFLLKGTIDSVLNPLPNDGGFIRYGTLRIHQRQKTAAAGVDYLTDFDDWLCVQNGEDRRETDQFDPDRRFIRNLRDLATYVHFDALYEAYLNACFILLNMPARFDPGNPYVDSRTQEGFGTFGSPHILTLVTEVATRALKAVWFQKWFVHRRLRPEEFGGRIDVHLRGRPGVPPGTRYPMINGEILASLQAGGGLDPHFPHPVDGTYLLPQAFAEGAPTHPAYGAGHATVAGACVTILKAWFDESDVFDPRIVDAALFPAEAENRQPKVPNAAGTGLVDFPLPVPPDPPLTVGGELNKLAANISLGRNGAGVHWRSDYTESVKLGEEIAIRILQEQKPTYNEDHYFSLTKFDGTAITI